MTWLYLLFFAFHALLSLPPLHHATASAVTDLLISEENRGRLAHQELLSPRRDITGRRPTLLTLRNAN